MVQYGHPGRRKFQGVVGCQCLPEHTPPRVRVVEHIADIPRDAWNALGVAPYPLLRHRAKRYPHMPQVKIQVHQRFTAPLSAMVLLLLGMPFVLCRESTGVFLGIGICLLVCGAFFVTSFVFQDLGNKRFVQPLLASWSPVVLYGSAGVCLFFGTIRT